MTRASGKSLTVAHRKVKNQRLAAAGYLWAFSALTPRAAATLTTTQLAALLRHAGRHRGIDTEAKRIQAILGTEFSTSSPSSRTPSAATPRPYFEHSTPPPPTPRASPLSPSTILTSTRR